MSASAIVVTMSDPSDRAPGVVRIRGAGWSEDWPLAMWDAMLGYFRWQEDVAADPRFFGLADACEAWRAAQEAGELA